MESLNSRYITDYLTIEKTARLRPFAMSSKHFHHECEIYYLIDGSGKYFIENESYDIAQGSLVIIDSLQIHTTDFKTSPTHQRILIELNANYFEETLFKICNLSLKDFFKHSNGVYSIQEDNQDYILNLFSSILTEIKNKSFNYERMLFIKLAELLIYLTRHENKVLCFTTFNNLTPETSIIVKKSIDYIIHNFEKPLSLAIIAEHLFINKCYLSRIFKEITNFTVHEYINLQRIKHAQFLLENSSYSISEIAHQIGYNSTNYFERVFKKHTEMTPIKFRQRYSLINDQIRSRNYNEVSLNPVNKEI